MAATLAHRGPDDAGSWADARGEAALGFRHLDHRPDPGRSPADELGRRRLTVVLNGEIYNFASLRDELQRRWARLPRPLRHGGPRRGDPPVELEAALPGSGHVRIRRLGRPRAEAASFAIALQEAPLLRLAGRELLFGRSFKALQRIPTSSRPSTGTRSRELPEVLLRPVPALHLRRHPEASAGSLAHHPPGSTGEMAEPSRYWDPVAVASRARGSAAPLRRRRRLQARTACGCGLPGGRRRTAGGLPVRRHRLLDGGRAPPGAERPSCFDVHDRLRLERVRRVGAYAAAVARHLGTDHIELKVTPEETARSSRLPELYDEPFQMPSQIPTFLVSELARRSVTVALQGTAATRSSAVQPVRRGTALVATGPRPQPSAVAWPAR